MVQSVTFFQNCPLAPDGLFESMDSCIAAKSRIKRVACSTQSAPEHHNKLTANKDAPYQCMQADCFTKNVE